MQYVRTLSPRFNWVGIYVLRGGTLELGPFLGAPTEHTRIKVGDGVCGTAVALDRDLNVPDVTQAENYLSCSAETKSELVVLVRDRAGQVVAQIDIDSHTPAAFGDAEVEAVRDVANRLGETWPGDGL